MRYITKAFMKTKKHVYIWTYKWKIPMFESIKLYSGWEGIWGMNIRANKQKNGIKWELRSYQRPEYATGQEYHRIKLTYLT